MEMIPPSPRSRIGVVILNYLDYESTIKCLRSVHECDPLPQAVVIVDNKSPNESLKHLKEAADGLPITAVICAEKNAGFSAGHNLGIEYLRRHGCADFVLATADTEIVSKNLFAEFETEISDDIGVIGPRIVQPDGSPQNPSVEILSLRYCFALLWFSWGRPGQAVWRKLRRLHHRHRDAAPSGTIESLESQAPTTARTVYKLHGSFMMLTHAYINRVGLLDESIFMFGEEDLISWRCEIAGLRRLLVQNSLVRHQNDSSIESAHGRDANEFVGREERKSGRILRKNINFLGLLRRCISA